MYVGYMNARRHLHQRVEEHINIRYLANIHRETRCLAGKPW